MRDLWVVAATLVCLVAARDASVLLHEWAHAAAGWCFGLTRGPFDIHYGGWTLIGAYDRGDDIYPRLFAADRGAVAALVAVAGPLTNGILAVVCLLALRHPQPA